MPSFTASNISAETIIAETDWCCRHCGTRCCPPQRELPSPGRPGAGHRYEMMAYLVDHRAARLVDDFRRRSRRGRADGAPVDHDVVRQDAAGVGAYRRVMFAPANPNDRGDHDQNDADSQQDVADLMRVETGGVHRGAEPHYGPNDGQRHPGHDQPDKLGSFHDATA
jgi:hypothetical protein